MTKKSQIIKLRKRGCSIGEISKAVNCARSTASFYCKNVMVTGAANLRLEKRLSLGNRNSAIANKKRREERWEKARQEALNEWNDIKNDPVMMGFLGLYWGEGSKKLNQRISICNTDPAILSIALKQFNKLNPNTNKVAIIRYYDDHDPDKLLKYWAAILPSVRIQLVEAKKYDLRCGKRKSKCQYGVGVLQFSDINVLIKILTWINCWKAAITQR